VSIVQDRRIDAVESCAVSPQDNDTTPDIDCAARLARRELRERPVRLPRPDPVLSAHEARLLKSAQIALGSAEFSGLPHRHFSGSALNC
jgi:hypothetical protein